jgi:hypothetical protein
MSLTAGRLLRLAYDRLGQTNYSTITSATTTSIVDSSLVDAYPDDVWEDGAVFIVAVTNDASPEDQFARISAYAGDTGTFTLQDALAADPPDGSEYAWASSLYPVMSMFRLITAAMRMCGPTPIDVDLTLVDDQVEYDIPVAYKRLRPLAVLVQWGETSWQNDVEPDIIHDFHVRHTTANAVGKLRLPGCAEAGVAKVLYVGDHAEVSAYTSLISDYLDEELCVLALVTKMLEWQIGRTQGAEQYVKDDYNKYLKLFNERLVLHAPDVPATEPNLLIPGPEA